MGYSLEQNTFIIMSYYRNGVLNENVFTCIHRVLCESLKTPIRRIVARFNDTGSVSKGKPTRPRVSEDVEDLRTRMEESPKKSLSKLSLQSGVPYSTCQKIVQYIRFRWFRSCNQQIFLAASSIIVGFKII
ncbi:hypothetical protein Zmor_017450 [Zophobas morio]|uniref:DUF4817 domain-containing protein n=1 Tax=Zophobas morio TaxID=2755281 RepID=A0AA38I8H7_9CUCU|nr:hypothetical protein Zmor_017450 [Zophobas morio]